MSCGNANYLGPDSCGFTGCIRYGARYWADLAFPTLKSNVQRTATPPGLQIQRLHQYETSHTCLRSRRTEIDYVLNLCLHMVIVEAQRTLPTALCKAV